MVPTRRTFIRTAAMGAVGTAIAGRPATAEGASSRGPLLAHRPATTQELGDRFDPWIEVEADALAVNVAEIRRLADNRPILAGVKNNAYGLDLTTAAGLLEPFLAAAEELFAQHDDRRQPEEDSLVHSRQTS